MWGKVLIYLNPVVQKDAKLKMILKYSKLTVEEIEELRSRM